MDHIGRKNESNWEKMDQRGKNGSKWEKWMKVGGMDQSTQKNGSDYEKMGPIGKMDQIVGKWIELEKLIRLRTNESN